MKYEKEETRLMKPETDEIIVMINGVVSNFTNYKDAIKFLQGITPKVTRPRIPKAIFYHIAGYECLRDGTQISTIKGMDELQSWLNEYEIEFDKSIEDFYELVSSIEDEWADRWDDGGGSGWIETK